jgi:hypothetical protein
MNFFGDFGQRLPTRIDSDEEFLRILARAPADKEPVPGPDIYNYSPVVRSNELVKSPAVKLSGGSTAN